MESIVLHGAWARFSLGPAVCCAKTVGLCLGRVALMVMDNPASLIGGTTQSPRDSLFGITACEWSGCTISWLFRWSPIVPVQQYEGTLSRFLTSRHKSRNIFFTSRSIMQQPTGDRLIIFQTSIQVYRLYKRASGERIVECSESKGIPSYHSVLHS